jgi:hypothetical protein
MQEPKKIQVKKKKVSCVGGGGNISRRGNGEGQICTLYSSRGDELSLSERRDGGGCGPRHVLYGFVEIGQKESDHSE